MASPSKYNIRLTYKKWKKTSVIHKKETSKTIRSRCQIIIDLEEYMATVTKAMTKYINGGVDVVAELKGT